MRRKGEFVAIIKEPRDFVRLLGTQSELGRRLGVRPERARQILAKAERQGRLPWKHENTLFEIAQEFGAQIDPDLLMPLNRALSKGELWKLAGNGGHVELAREYEAAGERSKKILATGRALAAAERKLEKSKREAKEAGAAIKAAKKMLRRLGATEGAAKTAATLRRAELLRRKKDADRAKQRAMEEAERRRLAQRAESERWHRREAARGAYAQWHDDAERARQKLWCATHAACAFIFFKANENIDPQLVGVYEFGQAPRFRQISEIQLPAIR